MRAPHTGHHVEGHSGGDASLGAGDLVVFPAAGSMWYPKL